MSSTMKQVAQKLLLPKGKQEDATDRQILGPQTFTEILEWKLGRNLFGLETQSSTCQLPPLKFEGLYI